MSPTFVAILRDFEKPVVWQETVLAAFHLVWTLPVGIILFLALLWKDRYFAYSVSRQINVASLVTIIAIFMIWFYTLLNRIFALTGDLLEVKPH